MIRGYVPFTLRGFGGGVIGLVAAQAASLLVEAFIARRLGAGGLGILAIGMSVSTLFSATIIAGCTSALVRGVAQADHRGETATVRGHLILGIGTALGSSLLAMLVLLAFAGEISLAFVGDESATSVLRVFALSLPLSAVGGVSLAATRALRRISYDVIGRVVDASIRALAIPGLLFASFGVREVAVIHLAAAAVALPVAVLPVVRQSPLFSFDVVPRYELGAFFGLAGWQSLAAGAWAAARRVDVLSVAATLGPRAAGVYRLAALVAGVGGVVLAGLQPMFAPIAARRFAEGPGEALDHYRRVTRFAVLASAPAFALCLAFPDRLLALFGPVFEGGAVALGVLAIAYAIDSLAGPATTFLLVIGGAHRVAANMVLALVIELALLAALIPPFGVTGAAIATAGTFLFVNAVQVLSVWHMLRHPVLDRPWLTSAALIGALFAISILLRAVAADARMTLVAFAATLIAYAFGVVRIGLPPGDRALLRGISSGSGQVLG